jgi:hypothetical protein
VFDAAPAVADSEWETYVAAIIAVERRVHAFQPATGLFKTSNETSFVSLRRGPPFQNRGKCDAAQLSRLYERG